MSIQKTKKKYSWLQAAEIAVRDYLEKECTSEEKIRGFHYRNQIYPTIRKEKLYATKSKKTPCKTLLTVLYKDIKDNPHSSIFVKTVSAGRFGLREYFEEAEEDEEDEEGNNINQKTERSSKRPKRENTETYETEKGRLTYTILHNIGSTHDLDCLH
jgi:hypothetical protein